MTNIRKSTPEDESAIRDVCGQAFGGEDEGRLVDALCEGRYERLALVAEISGDVVGVIVFSELAIVTEKTSIPGLLAPVAVLPAHQRRGVGSMLVSDGLRICRELGHAIVIVMGHHDYYPRFGFTAECAQPLKCRYDSGPSFMAIALSDGALDGVSGEVRYPPPFDVF